jgi:hypothetical protein
MRTSADMSTSAGALGLRCRAGYAPAVGYLRESAGSRHANERPDSYTWPVAGDRRDEERYREKSEQGGDEPDEARANDVLGRLTRRGARCALHGQIQQQAAGEGGEGRDGRDAGPQRGGTDRRDNDRRD